MQTLGEFHELKSNMLEKEENIIGNINKDNPDTLPNDQRIDKGKKHQDGALYS